MKASKISDGTNTTGGYMGDDTIALIDERIMKNLTILTVASLLFLTTACAKTSSTDPQPIYPEMDAPTPFTRAYSLTENPNGTIRVFAKENSDKTKLFVSYKTSRKWTTPDLLDLPHRNTLTSPSFSPADGRLYYSSDAEVQDMPGRKDLNLWSAKVTADGTSDATPLPLSINTGANEISPALDAEGHLYFSSNHSRAGGGGFDIMRASPQADGTWQVEPLPQLNDFRADAHLAITADGNRLMFYSHRTPKAGSVDIWVSDRVDGKWTAPVNAGDVINTSAIEFGPGLSGNGKTFFFSRDGQIVSVPMTVLQESMEQGLTSAD
jgi:Tol biopolymer transport system component